MTTKSLLHSSLLDNQYYTSMLVGNDAFVPGTFELLASEVLTSSQASVTFSSLGDYSEYQHLQIWITGRSSRNTTTSDSKLRFNGDSGSNYTWHYMRGDGSVTESAGAGSLDAVRMYQTLTAATNTSGSFATTVLDVLDPFESGKYTTVRFSSGFTGSISRVLLESGTWMNTASLTSMTFSEYYGSSFVAGTSFYLYGLRGA